MVDYFLPKIVVFCAFYGTIKPLQFKYNAASDGHRCGPCPTYFDKICAYDTENNRTYMFDNHCVMDIYNCLEGTAFVPIHYEHCIYIGNFAHVHGFKYEDQDYDEDNIVVKGSVKNPYFVG